MTTAHEQNKCAARTQALIESFRGNADEFAMLKGVLCASHVGNHADKQEFEAIFNGLMIAVRMDENRAENRKAVDALAKAGAA